MNECRSGNCFGVVSQLFKGRVTTLIANVIGGRHKTASRAMLHASSGLSGRACPDRRSIVVSIPRKSSDIHGTKVKVILYTCLTLA